MLIMGSYVHTTHTRNIAPFNHPINKDSLPHKLSGIGWQSKCQVTFTYLLFARTESLLRTLLDHHHAMYAIIYYISCYVPNKISHHVFFNKLLKWKEMFKNSQIDMSTYCLSVYIFFNRPLGKQKKIFDKSWWIYCSIREFSKISVENWNAWSGSVSFRLKAFMRSCTSRNFC